jgi:tetrathionate reductase subunit B
MTTPLTGPEQEPLTIQPALPAPAATTADPAATTADPAATVPPDGALDARGPRFTRRQVLKLGAVAVPSLLGAALVFDRASAFAGGGAADVDPIVATYDPTAHRWGFVVDVTSCIGCGLCVVACKEENGVPLDEEHTRTWVERHTVLSDGQVVVDTHDAGMLGFPPTESPTIPAGQTVATSYFVPRLCMQCEDSPCTAVCPVGATYRTPDGVVLVDQDRCIGCGYCVVACPYGARYIVPAGGHTPNGIAGVADKCTFCYHRITHGQEPACVEVCPRSARKFGDLNDPASEVSLILAQEKTSVMRPELGTKPRVHYIGLEAEEA